MFQREEISEGDAKDSRVLINDERRIGKLEDIDPVDQDRVEIRLQHRLSGIEAPGESGRLRIVDIAFCSPFVHETGTIRIELVGIVLLTGGNRRIAYIYDAIHVIVDAGGIIFPGTPGDQGHPGFRTAIVAVIAAFAAATDDQEKSDGKEQADQEKLLHIRLYWI